MLQKMVDRFLLFYAVNYPECVGTPNHKIRQLVKIISALQRDERALTVASAFCTNFEMNISKFPSDLKWGQRTETHGLKVLLEVTLIFMQILSVASFRLSLLREYKDSIAPDRYRDFLLIISSIHLIKLPEDKRERISNFIPLLVSRLVSLENMQLLMSGTRISCNGKLISLESLLARRELVRECFALDCGLTKNNAADLLLKQDDLEPLLNKVKFLRDYPEALNNQEKYGYVMNFDAAAYHVREHLLLYLFGKHLFARACANQLALSIDRRHYSRVLNNAEALGKMIVDIEESAFKLLHVTAEGEHELSKYKRVLMGEIRLDVLKNDFYQAALRQFIAECESKASGLSKLSFLFFYYEFAQHVAKTLCDWQLEEQWFRDFLIFKNMILEWNLSSREANYIESGRVRLFRSNIVQRMFAEIEKVNSCEFRSVEGEFAEVVIDSDYRRRELLKYVNSNFGVLVKADAALIESLSEVTTWRADLVCAFLFQLIERVKSMANVFHQLYLFTYDSQDDSLLLGDDNIERHVCCLRMKMNTLKSEYNSLDENVTEGRPCTALFERNRGEEESVDVTPTPYRAPA
jgi:hypothetical protein